MCCTDLVVFERTNGLLIMVADCRLVAFHRGVLVEHWILKTSTATPSMEDGLGCLLLSVK